MEQPMWSIIWKDTTPWVTLFRWLGSTIVFPPPMASDETLRSFALAALTVPLVIGLGGFVVSAILFCSLCCCRRQHRGGRPEKPSSKPLFFFALFTFATIIISSFACWLTGGSSFSTAKEQFDGAVKDLDSAETDGKNLNSTGMGVLDNLQALYMPPVSLCQNAVVAATVKSQIAPTVSQLQQYLNVINKYTAELSPLVTRLDGMKENSAGFSILTAAGLALPMLLVAASCIVIAFAVLTTQGFGGSRMARCTDCCLIRVGSIFITLSVFLATSVAASQCALGIVTSSFCHNVDANVLVYAQDAFGSNSSEYAATRHYITGMGVNPFNQTLMQGKGQIAQASAKFTGLEKQYGAFIKERCQGWTGLTVNEDLQQISAGIDMGLKLVSRTNIYPYYNRMVHEDLCETAIAGLGWLVVGQLLGGLFCLPVLAVMSASFFRKWAAWKDLLAQGFLVNHEVHEINSQIETTQQVQSA